MLDKSTELAFARTWLACERTMQAWIRTAISLITFGFSVFKLSDILEPAEESPSRLLGAHEFGYVLVGIGFVALFLGMLDSRINLNALRAEGYVHKARATSVIVGGVVAALGLLALALMIFQQ